MHTRDRSALPEGSIRDIALGTRIVAFFGLIWGLAGASALGRQQAQIITLVVLGITIGLLLSARALLRLAPSGAQTVSPLRRALAKRPYRLAVFFEVVAIPITVIVLGSTGNGDTVPSVVAMIVGIHFLGLAPAYSQRWAAVGGAMVVIGLVSLALPARTLVGSTTMEPRPALVGLGCAIALWAGVAPFVMLAYRHRGGPHKVP